MCDDDMAGVAHFIHHTSLHSQPIVRREPLAPVAELSNSDNGSIKNGSIIKCARNLVDAAS